MTKNIFRRSASDNEADFVDMFGAPLKVGDWIVYDAISGTAKDHRRKLYYGQISRMSRVMSSMLSIDVDNEELGEHNFTSPDRCLKFSQEEWTMRKLGPDFNG